MNYLAILKRSVFLFSLFLLSCQNPKNKQSIELFIEEKQLLANTENKPVFAEIELKDGKVYSEKTLNP